MEFVRNLPVVLPVQKKTECKADIGSSLCLYNGFLRRALSHAWCRYFNTDDKLLMKEVIYWFRLMQIHVQSIWVSVYFLRYPFCVNDFDILARF